MKIRSKSTNKNYLILSAIFTLSIATVFGVGIYTTNTTNALSYSTSEDISFTLKPTLSIGLSTNSLTIDNLVPGTTNDSNVVSITVSSNTPYGYVLSAGVGSTEPTDPYYNTSDLVHDNSTTQVPTTNKFSSIATSASLPTLDTDNAWGYSTSTDGGTNWSTYSGLSHTATKPLLDISDPATPSTIDFKIAARSASTQASGTYNNVITFYAVGKPEPLTLYEEVAKMSKGVQTAADLQTTIATPTSRDYREDTSNSGVYEYNSAVFGESSDASNANKIYYYRGVLEPEEDQGQYGSDGQATTYPNYVKLDNDTCWRIVRTTGSGGIKMIYNGAWNATNNTCASKNAYISQGSFNGNSSTDDRQMVRAGYTYNDTYAKNSNTNRSLSTLFGTNISDNNTSSSNIKTRIDTWYMNNLNNYSSILEPSAGYCGDRTVYDDSGQLQLESSSVPQYSESTSIYQFGSYIRNFSSGQSPSLVCAKVVSSAVIVDRSKVDLYSVSGSDTGNGRLSYPIALITADELSFAGSGSSITSGGSTHNGYSYTVTSVGFWTLSPGRRFSNGRVFISDIGYRKILSVWEASGGGGTRPTISLKPGTAAVSGSGTATDPWVVPAP